MSDLKTKITFLDAGTAFSTEEIYQMVGNRENSDLFFKKDKTLWLDGMEYKVKNIQFRVLETPEDGFNCEILIEVASI